MEQALLLHLLHLLIVEQVEWSRPHTPHLLILDLRGGATGSRVPVPGSRLARGPGFVPPPPATGTTLEPTCHRTAAAESAPPSLNGPYGYACQPSGREFHHPGSTGTRAPLAGQPEFHPVRLCRPKEFHVRLRHRVPVRRRETGLAHRAAAGAL